MNVVNRFFKKLKIVFRKPGLLFRLINNYFLILIGITRLRTVEIAVTYDCQCDCIHCCSAKMKSKEKKELSFEEISDLIDQAVDLGAIHILFTGGETLIPKEKLLRVLKYAKKKSCIISIDTNGILVDSSYVNDLKISGLDVACVSIDSTEQEKHDYFRGKKGCFEAAINGIDLFKKQGIEVLISYLATRESLGSGSIYKILNLASEKKSNVIFCLPVLVGNLKGKEDYALRKKDMLLLDKVMKHPLAMLCEENNYLVKGCSAGSEKISITLYGDVTPCSFIKESYGNIRDNSLKKILLKMRSIKKYSKVNKEIRCLAAGEGFNGNSL